MNPPELHRSSPIKRQFAGMVFFRQTCADDARVLHQAQKRYR
jgi:hypothetical protein